MESNLTHDTTRSSDSFSTVPPIVNAGDWGCIVRDLETNIVLVLLAFNLIPQRGVPIAHRYTYAPPRCRTSQYRRTFIPWSVSLWNDLSDPVFDGLGLAGFKSKVNAFLLA